MLFPFFVILFLDLFKLILSKGRARQQICINVPPSTVHMDLCVCVCVCVCVLGCICVSMFIVHTTLVYTPAFVPSLCHTSRSNCLPQFHVCKLSVCKQHTTDAHAMQFRYKFYTTTLIATHQNTLHNTHRCVQIYMQIQEIAKSLQQVKHI